MARGKKTGGRSRGTLNKVTAAAKSAIEAAYTKIGGDKQFAEWAKANPTEFYTRCFVKLLPKELEHSGADGGPIEIRVRFVKDERAK